MVNMLLFQVGWFVCLLNGSLAALGYTLCVLLLHSIFMQHSWREWYLFGAMALTGTLWDGLLSSLGLIQFLPAGVILLPPIALAPVWLVCLWVLFATTVNHSLYWLSAYPRVAILLAATVAPISYYAGVKLGAAHLSPPPWRGLLAIALGWGFVVPWALIFCRRYCRPDKNHTLNR